MATSFPTGLDALTNPTASDYLSSPSHSAQHANSNDSIEALEAKVGIDSSAVTTSHDYKLAHLYVIGSTLNPPRGHLINGKIVPSVASNNLTVAIKGMDGNDPSATNPVYCRIGDTVRSITAALSVTKNAATNWCAAGSSELATKEIDYFVYLGYNATDGVVVGFSRIPYANEYDDFSATTTDEKYCAISTITNAAAGDDYEVIGRFAATLSAGAGYTWSVPTFTNKNLIQRPIYRTRVLSWAPTIVGYSANPADTMYAYYIDNDWMTCTGREATSGTSNSASKTYTAPFTAKTVTNGLWSAAGTIVDNGSVIMGRATIASASNLISVSTYNGSFTTSGDARALTGMAISFRI